jgi:hypothetical protein
MTAKSSSGHSGPAASVADAGSSRVGEAVTAATRAVRVLSVRLTFLAATVVTAVLVLAPQAGADPQSSLFLTGGGWLGQPDQEVTFGLRLACSNEAGPPGGPNRLEVGFGPGSHFHLETITTAECSTTDPKSGGIYRGTGIGECNGAPAMARFIFRPSANRDENGAAIQVSGDDPSCQVFQAFQLIGNGSLEFHVPGGPSS